jgi:phosphohistidine phosphatase
VTLYLLRHGIAEDAPPGGSDRARRLTPRGRARMRRAALGLRVLVRRVDTILTSPYPRAAETATLAAAALGKAPKPRELDALVPGSSPMDVLRVLRTTPHGERVMLVGHEPLLSELAALLLTGSVDGARIVLKKGGCIAVSIRSPAPRAASLEWAASPRVLRRLGRSRDASRA